MSIYTNIRTGPALQKVGTFQHQQSNQDPAPTSALSEALGLIMRNNILNLVTYTSNNLREPPWGLQQDAHTPTYSLPYMKIGYTKGIVICFILNDILMTLEVSGFLQKTLQVTNPHGTPLPKILTPSPFRIGSIDAIITCHLLRHRHILRQWYHHN